MLSVFFQNKLKLIEKVKLFPLTFFRCRQYVTNAPPSRPAKWEKIALRNCIYVRCANDGSNLKACWSQSPSIPNKCFDKVSDKN